MRTVDVRLVAYTECLGDAHRCFVARVRKKPYLQQIELLHRLAYTVMKRLVS